jgi:heme oxygenase (biliverdin-IX-beta and delta-forming)
MITMTSLQVLPVLRNATAQLHMQLDASLPLAAAYPSIEDYSQHLLGFKHWLSDIDRFIAGSSLPAEEFRAINANAMKLLEDDLQGMGLEVRDPASPTANPIKLDAACCLGIEYVVKGSALGTAMLYNKASRMFPVAPMSFMQDAMKHGKDRWKQFLLKLDSHHWTESELASAQEGAIWAFQRYIKLHEMSLQPQ